MRRAWAAGVRTFDTAPYYGHGLAEELLGAVLQQVPRDELVLSTKVGRLLVPGDPGEAFFQGIPHRVRARLLVRRAP